MPVLKDWLTRNNYTMNQWATNAGGRKDDGTDDFYRKDKGVKSRFMRYFKGREFSKLHNDHVTTRPGRSHISVPSSLLRSAVDLAGIGQ